MDHDNVQAVEPNALYSVKNRQGEIKAEPLLTSTWDHPLETIQTRNPSTLKRD